MEAHAVPIPTGVAPTRIVFARWAQRPLPLIVPWAVGGLLIGLALLGAALAVALVVGPTAREAYLPVFADPTAGDADVLRIFGRNAMVLALQALVCVATFLATRPGDHEELRPLAVSVIAGLALYSLGSQAWRLGHDLASAADTLSLTPAELVLRLSVHAVPELTAIFLPLAACIALKLRGREDDLGAAALLTTIVAVPVVAAAAGAEVYLTPLFL